LETRDIDLVLLFDGSVQSNYPFGPAFPPIPDEIVLPLNPGEVRLLKVLTYHGVADWSVNDTVHFCLIYLGSQASGMGYDIGAARLVTVGLLLVGNYGVKVSVTNTEGTLDWEDFTVVVTFASGIPSFAIVCGLAALVVGLPLWSVAVMQRKRRTQLLRPELAGKGGVLLEETAAQTPVSLKTSEPSIMPVSRRDYRLPRRCPDCGAPVIRNEVEWVGPSEAKCSYCGAVLEATLKRV
jgi:hypothetical protein